MLEQTHLAYRNNPARTKGQGQRQRKGTPQPGKRLGQALTPLKGNCKITFQPLAEVRSESLGTSSPWISYSETKEDLGNKLSRSSEWYTRGKHWDSTGTDTTRTVWQDNLKCIGILPPNRSDKKIRTEVEKIIPPSLQETSDIWGTLREEWKERGFNLQDENKNWLLGCRPSDLVETSLRTSINSKKLAPVTNSATLNVPDQPDLHVPDQPDLHVPDQPDLLVPDQPDLLVSDHLTMTSTCQEVSTAPDQHDPLNENLGVFPVPN